MDQVILIDKPTAMTSFGVVARIRRVLTNQAGKRVKVGHCGTLDPFATGLLVLVAGKETKRAMEYTKLDKVYEATFRLGETSSTGDPEGEITKVSDKIPEAEEIQKVIDRFVGEIEQRPPIYSAIKINGQRAYKLARKGEEVNMPTRMITIHSIELIDYSYPELIIRTHVSSGTYIRTLGEDIGATLGVGAYCSQLRRTKIGQWSIDDSQTLSTFGIED